MITVKRVRSQTDLKDTDGYFKLKDCEQTASIKPQTKTK